jgi:sugar lactone lactonase YvrE
MFIGNNLISRRSLRSLLCLLLLLVLVQGACGIDPCSVVRPWRWYEDGSDSLTYRHAVDTLGNVYVTEPARGRIVQYSPEGMRNYYWDLGDTETGKVVVPAGIAIDASRTLYVTDHANDTVVKLNWWKKEIWGSEGSGSGQFADPAGIAIDSSGNVYVADTGNNRIQKFHSSGKLLLQWGSYGVSDGAFNGPAGLAADAYGHVYITDTGNNRVQKFTGDGTFLSRWGTPGTGNGQFSTLSGIAIDSWGNIWVADRTTRIQEFNPAGEFLASCNTSSVISDVVVSPSGTIYTFSPSDPSRTSGESVIPSSVPAETPVKHPASGITAQSTIPATATAPATVTLQGAPAQAQLPVSPVTSFPPMPEYSPASGHIAMPSPAPENTSVTGTGINPSTGSIPESKKGMGFADTIAGFFRELFGMKFPFSV